MTSNELGMDSLNMSQAGTYLTVKSKSQMSTCAKNALTTRKGIYNTKF